MGIFYFKYMKSFYVYVIKSSKGLHYTGMTENIEKRLNEHNNKSLSFWTKRDSDWIIVYKEEFDDKTKALKREKWLKTGVGREFLQKKLNEK